MTTATERPQTAMVAYRPTDLDTPTLGAILARSGFFQDTKDEAQAIVKILAGRELGFGPIASMQGVYIVKGRVTLAANLIGAAIQRSGKYSYTVKELTSEKCVLLFSAQNGGAGRTTFESSFTMQDARDAGLAGSQTYKNFPRNMLFSRALTNGARWFCPEVFNGPIYTPDEVGAAVDAEGYVVTEAGHTVDRNSGEVVVEAQPAAFVCVYCVQPIIDNRNGKPVSERSAQAIVTKYGELVDKACLDRLHTCANCERVVKDQGGQPINDSQAETLKGANVEGFLLCRDCREPGGNQAA